jgi:hypothetical protein
MQRPLSLPTLALFASILGREVPLCGPRFLQLLQLHSLLIRKGCGKFYVPRMPAALSLFQNHTAEAVNEVRKEGNETMLAFLEVLGLIQVRDSSTGKVTSCRLD